VTAILVESSVVVEVLVRGPDKAELVEKLSLAPVRFSTPITRLESGLVLLGQHGWSRADFERGFASLGTIEIPIDAEIGRLALDAFERYGKGRHKAKLNFGDCLSYATAKRHGLALLFVGKDFAATDVARA
jgi:ribonuclease VapC